MEPSGPSRRSRIALDAANFFLAQLTGIGYPFLSDLLRERAWDYDAIGIAASMSGLGVLLAQTPAGLFVDRWPRPRRLLALTAILVGACYASLPLLPPRPGPTDVVLFVSGLAQAFFAPLLAGLGMEAQIHEGPVGAASAIKMVRSIVMKGLEAIVAECVLAGTKAGVIDAVLDSLDDTYPGFDWRKRSAYMLERVMTHGLRRAAEMREAALTVELLGLDPAMSSASVRWQQEIGELGLRATADEAADFRLLADRILAGLAAGTPKGLPPADRDR